MSSTSRIIIKPKEDNLQKIGLQESRRRADLLAGDFEYCVKELEGREDASSGSSMPAWAESSMTARPSEPRLQKQEAQSPSRPQLDFAEPSSGSFEFISQVSCAFLQLSNLKPLARQLL